MTVLGSQGFLATKLERHFSTMTAPIVQGFEIIVLLVNGVRRTRLPFVVTHDGK